MCYSLYLVHQLIVRAVSAAFLRFGASSDMLTLCLTVPACVAASVAVAAAFYVVIERRFLNHSPAVVPVELGSKTTHCHWARNRQR